MVILDKGYTETRQKYIVDLAEYYLGYKSLRQFNIKNLLLNRVINVKHGNSGKEFIYYFNKDDLFKALLGDVFLFYIRSVLQHNNFNCIDKVPEISPNWHVVTSYYSAFFDCCLLLILCHRGSMFFENDIKRRLEITTSNFLGERVDIGNKVVFMLEIRDGDYVIVLRKITDGTHEIVWKQCGDLINELSMLSGNNRGEKHNDEIVFLRKCQQLINDLKYQFPSQLRNKVNYRPIFGLEVVDNKFYKPTNGLNWVHEIMGYENTGKDIGDNKIANVYAAYAMYVHVLAYRLINDYFEISGREDHILAKINANRERKITLTPILYNYN